MMAKLLQNTLLKITMRTLFGKKIYFWLVDEQKHFIVFLEGCTFGNLYDKDPQQRNFWPTIRKALQMHVPIIFFADLFYYRTTKRKRNQPEININNRYKSISRPERALTPIGEHQGEMVGHHPPSATLTKSTTIDVEAAKDLTEEVVQQSLPGADAKVKEEADTDREETPARPIGPKPAKVVDSNTINLSAFMHFAPKS